MTDEPEVFINMPAEAIIRHYLAAYGVEPHRHEPLYLASQYPHVEVINLPPGARIYTWQESVSALSLDDLPIQPETRWQARRRRTRAALGRMMWREDARNLILLVLVVGVAVALAVHFFPYDSIGLFWGVLLNVAWVHGLLAWVFVRAYRRVLREEQEV